MPNHRELTQKRAQDQDFLLEETKTTLLVYAGEARVSHTGGDSWLLADTGLWLEAGDRIQVAEGGIAVIIFPDSSLIRLEGFSDFELIVNEFDFAGGSKRVIGRVWDGFALVSTPPLPTANSLFQLWSMTTFINLTFDSSQAVPLQAVDQIGDQGWIAFGALMSEDLWCSACCCNA